MTLVRGSVDRLRLDWSGRDHAVGPDGYLYEIQSETVRGEPKAYWAMSPDRRELETLERAHGVKCQYGYVPTLADARRVCEWHAWVSAGRPSR